MVGKKKVMTIAVSPVRAMLKRPRFTAFFSSALMISRVMTVAAVSKTLSAEDMRVAMKPKITIRATSRGRVFSSRRESTWSGAASGMIAIAAMPIMPTIMPTIIFRMPANIDDFSATLESLELRSLP